MAFSDKLVGICPVCGGSGDFYGDQLNLSATADSVGKGYDLVTYQGRIMCKRCKKQIQTQDESRMMSDNWQKEEAFRARAGYTK